MSTPTPIVEAAAYMYPSNLDEFARKEMMARAYSVSVTNVDTGERTVPLYRESELASLRAANKTLRDALADYANPLNWAEDAQGIRRVWLEPDGHPREAYNGFERAAAATKEPT